MTKRLSLGSKFIVLRYYLNAPCWAIRYLRKESSPSTEAIEDESVKTVFTHLIKRLYSTARYGGISLVNLCA
jgi:SNF family Na+-dependent transporter